MIKTCIDKLKLFPYFEIDPNVTFSDEIINNIYKFVTEVYKSCSVKIKLSNIENKPTLIIDNEFKYENVLTTIKKKITDMIPQNSMFDVQFKFVLVQDK